MVTFLVARAPTQPAAVVAEVILEPVSSLFERQVDALGALAAAAATVARTATGALGPAAAPTLAALAAVVVVSFLVAGVVALASARPRPGPRPAS